MTLYINIINPNSYEYAKFEFQRFDNGAAYCYFDAQTADGYNLHGEIDKIKQVVLANVFIESVLNTSVYRLSEIANKCRTLNDNPELSSMLSELDSCLEELNADNYKEESNQQP